MPPVCQLAAVAAIFFLSIHQRYYVSTTAKKILLSLAYVRTEVLSVHATETFSSSSMLRDLLPIDSAYSSQSCQAKIILTPFPSRHDTTHLSNDHHQQTFS